MFRWLSVLIILAVISFSSQADTAKQAEAIKAKLAESFPTHIPDSVSKSPVEGLYEAVYGTQVIYVTEDARYIIQGVIMDLEDGKRDITEVATSRARQKYMTQVNEQESISFGAEKPKHTITVFTDIDCGYCRKLHNEMDQLNDLGITVRYLAFPRGGLKSQTYTDMVSVWCADNKQEAMNNAKAGGTVASENCKTQVAEQYAFGKKIGVNGTPNIIMPDGSVIPGYQPAKQLEAALKALL